jgi:hypothetical protein
VCARVLTFLISNMCFLIYVCARFLYQTCFFLYVQETGFAHMRICDGVGSFLQLSGLLAKYGLVRETAKVQ